MKMKPPVLRPAKRQQETRGCKIKEANKELDVEEGIRYESNGKFKKLKRSELKGKLWKFSSFRPVEVKVWCGKEWHTIKFTKKGRIVLCNHSNMDIDAQLALRGLGSRHRCRCLTVKKHFIKVAKREAGVIVSVPPDLQKELARAKRRSVCRARRNGPINIVSDHLTVPFKMRASVVKKVLARDLGNSSLFNSAEGQIASKYKCRIKINCATNQTARRKIRKWDSGEFIMELPELTSATDPNYGPRAPLPRTRWNMSISNMQTCHGITIREDWWETIYKRGMAIVDGCIAWQFNVPTNVRSNVEKVSLIRVGSMPSPQYQKGKGKGIPVAKMYNYWGTEISKSSDGQWHISKLF
jgi:hypothetical protein